MGDYSGVPLETARRWALNFLPVSFVNEYVIHLTDPEPDALPLCGRQGSLWHRDLSPLVADKDGILVNPMCKECVDIAERKRSAKLAPETLASAYRNIS